MPQTADNSRASAKSKNSNTQDKQHTRTHNTHFTKHNRPAHHSSYRASATSTARRMHHAYMQHTRTGIAHTHTRKRTRAHAHACSHGRPTQRACAAQGSRRGQSSFRTGIWNWYKNIGFDKFHKFGIGRFSIVEPANMGGENVSTGRPAGRPAGRPVGRLAPPVLAAQ